MAEAATPDVALHLIQSIYDHSQILRDFSESGYRYWDITDRHIRILLYGHYRIAYLIKQDRDVDVIGVFHGSLKIGRYLL